MTDSSSVPPADDIDLGSLGSRLWRAKGRIIALPLIAGAITFIALPMMRPLYTSEARILVQNEETAFTRPMTEQGNATYRTALDEQAMQSQVQVLNSRDLILKVVRDLDLTQNANFASDAGGSHIDRLLRAIGFGGSSRESQEERAANAAAEHLDVYQVSNSSVIALEFMFGDPELAAQIANKLADVYINGQRDEKIAQTKEATAWLDAEIKALRKATAEPEAAVETFKASEGLYAGSNDVTLNAQKLSELNSQLILAEAQESEAQARAKLIKKMLATSGDIDATLEVLNSQVVINLIEQRVLVQRQLAELSATLLPSHPQIQQLRSELADVRAQIRTEAQKVVKSLENQAQIAAAREASLRASLHAAKSQSAGQSDAEVKLKALEREAKANRDLLESYPARYRDASARHDIGEVPAQAAIVSRAHASVLPSFPRRGPITLLVTAAALLLTIGTVLAETIIVSDAPRWPRTPSQPYPTEELVPSEPEYMSPAKMQALSRMSTAPSRAPRTERRTPNTKPVIENRRTPEARPKRKLRKRPDTNTQRPTSQAAPGQAPSSAPAEASAAAQAAEPHKSKPEPSAEVARPKTETADKATIGRETDIRKTEPEKPAARQTLPATVSAPAHVSEPGSETKPSPGSKPASAPSSKKTQRTVWRAAKPAKRPSWLAVSEPRSIALDAPKPSETTAERTAQAHVETSQPKPGPEPKSSSQTASSEAPPEGSDTKSPAVSEPDKAPDNERAKKDIGILAAMAAPAIASATKAALSASQDGSKDVPSKEPVDAASIDRKATDKSAAAPTDTINDSGQDTQLATSKDFIQRIRQDVIKQGEAERTATAAPKRASSRLLDRLRGKSTKNKSTKDEAMTSPDGAAPAALDKRQANLQHQDDEKEMASLSPNDLRHYLTQRIATYDDQDEWDSQAAQSADLAELGPVIGSLDEVVETVLESSTGGLPRTMLLAGLSARAPSPQAAIGIARDLAGRNEPVALVDLAKGAAVVSGRLNMPRVPGFSDLVRGAVDFADVIKLDDGSTLQVIPAGNPTLNDDFDASDKFMRVFDALTQTYDCVVLHADMAAIESLMPALKFELPVAVAVLPPRSTPRDEREPLSVVQRLGCPVVLYGTATKNKPRGFSLFGRKVAV